MAQEKEKRIIRVHRSPDMFSLTAHGNHFLGRERRLSRDRFRLFLLKESRAAKVTRSCEESATELGGVAPSADNRTSLKGREANKIGLSLPQGQSCWPRFSKQLTDQTGQSQPSHDADLLPFLSFQSTTQIAVALGEPERQLELNYEVLGLMLGISPRLIVQIWANPKRHYRQYPIAKKGGGTRLISSPRTFLKVIQQFLADYFFTGLPVHDAVHSYRIDHSIISNASQHVGKPFVGNIDISDYFGSVKEPHVAGMLRENGFKGHSAYVLAKLCTLNGSLPQGAPTSPALSNAFLYSFDKQMSRYCVGSGLSYTRYADDISISGEIRQHIISAIDFASKCLNIYFGLSLNAEKTRIASSGGQQRVTGVVVNDAVRPPKKFRREVRAAFNNAAKADAIEIKTFKKLSGYVSFLMSFDALRETKEVTRYQSNLKELRAKVVRDDRE